MALAYSVRASVYRARLYDDCALASRRSASSELVVARGSGIAAATSERLSPRSRRICPVTSSIAGSRLSALAITEYVRRAIPVTASSARSVNSRCAPVGSTDRLTTYRAPSRSATSSAIESCSAERLASRPIRRITSAMVTGPTMLTRDDCCSALCNASVSAREFVVSAPCSCTSAITSRSPRSIGNAGGRVVLHAAALAAAATAATIAPFHRRRLGRTDAALPDCCVARCASGAATDSVAAGGTSAAATDSFATTEVLAVTTCA